MTSGDRQNRTNPPHNSTSAAMRFEFLTRVAVETEKTNPGFTFILS